MIIRLQGSGTFADAMRRLVHNFEYADDIVVETGEVVSGDSWAVHVLPPLFPHDYPSHQGSYADMLQRALGFIEQCSKTVAPIRAMVIEIGSDDAMSDNNMHEFEKILKVIASQAGVHLLFCRVPELYGKIAEGEPNAFAEIAKEIDANLPFSTPDGVDANRHTVGYADEIARDLLDVMMRNGPTTGRRVSEIQEELDSLGSTNTEQLSELVPMLQKHKRLMDSGIIPFCASDLERKVFASRLQNGARICPVKGSDGNRCVCELVSFGDSESVDDIGIVVYSARLGKDEALTSGYARGRGCAIVLVDGLAELGFAQDSDAVMFEETIGRERFEEEYGMRAKLERGEVRLVSPFEHHAILCTGESAVLLLICLPAPLPRTRSLSELG